MALNVTKDSSIAKFWKSMLIVANSMVGKLSASTEISDLLVERNYAAGHTLPSRKANKRTT